MTDLTEAIDPAALAHFVVTVNFGMSVQAASGASRTELLKVVQIALRAFPTTYQIRFYYPIYNEPQRRRGRREKRKRIKGV